MAYTDQTMFEYIKNVNGTDNVTFSMCVNSFNKFEKGTQGRSVLVNLACKILIISYNDDPENLGLTLDELKKTIDNTIKFK